MSVGNDGFTDCNYVCNPENDMSWSCNKYCPGYKFIATTPTTLTTTESRHDSSTESGDVETNEIVYVCIGLVLLAILMIICCLNKNRICACVKACRDKRLQLPTQVQTPATNGEAESSRPEADQDDVALLSIRSENGGSGDVSENSNDSGVSVADTTLHFEDVPGVDGNAALGNEQSSTPEFTHAGEQHDDWSQKFNEESDHTDDETDPKEVGEFACLAIGQKSPFVNDVATNPVTGTTTAMKNAENIYEGGGHVTNNVLNRSDDSTDDTDSSSIACGDESDHGICSDENDNYDEDDDVDDAARSACDKDIASNEGILNDYTDRKENTVSNKKSIVRVVTEINLREH